MGFLLKRLTKHCLSFLNGLIFFISSLLPLSFISGVWNGSEIYQNYWRFFFCGRDFWEEICIGYEAFIKSKDGAIIAGAILGGFPIPTPSMSDVS